ncbi:MAG: hypothetical protein PWQ97_450 [Tepidanaerobacteraceae bacterium]|nr:hypothetical protein [Tepidanaerobacteraceae bacterium]
MPIIITSKKDGLRRCGIEHPARPTTYEDDFFTAEQLEILKKEPLLIVVEQKIKKNSKKDSSDGEE